VTAPQAWGEDGSEGSEGSLALPETEALWYLSDASKEHKALLKVREGCTYGYEANE